MTAGALSKWWAGSSHRAMGATNDVTVRLALALTPVRSVIRVIDDHVPPMTVDWAAVHDGKSISATNFARGEIIINPLPITEQKITTAKALDVVTGFAIHEASHGKESRDRYRYLIKQEPGKHGKEGTVIERPAFRPMRIAAYLWNVVEDVRIEDRTARKWPGSKPYFEAVLEYMWKHPDDLPEGKALVQRLRTVYIACRYPDRINVLPAGEQVEAAWWMDWQADYLSDTVDTPTTIQRGLDRLALDAEAKSEMNEMQKAEEREEAAGERVRAQIERLMQEGIEGAYGVCVTEDGDVIPLDEETAGKVDQLIREGLIEARPVVFANGASNPPHYITKPEETAKSRRSYIGRPNAESEALRAALVFRSSAPQFDVKLLKSGTLDDEELYRWGMKDYRVFSERIIEAKPDVFMGLLVDCSGSMSGSKLKTAQRLAQLLVWALHDQEGVDTAVWGHTGDGADDASVDIYRIWEKGDPISRMGIFTTLDHRNNYDGHAISYVVKQVMDQPHPQKVVIVLSDGLPSGQGYGGPRGMAHMRQVCTWASRHGVQVIQIAIDSSINPTDQAAMFGEGNWLPYKNDRDLPKQLARLMARFT